MGVIAAWRAGSWIDRVVMGFAVLGFSIPVFVLGYLFIFVFAVELRWLPVQGYKPIGDGFWPFLQSIALPTLTLGVIYIALIARITRASMLEVLHEDYIRTAQAKGLGTPAVLLGHALKEGGGADRDHHRGRRGAPDRRRRDHRERVRDSGPRPSHGRRDPAPRLPDHPGRDPGVLGRLRAGQPADRHHATRCSIHASATDTEGACARGDRGGTAV